MHWFYFFLCITTYIISAALILAFVRGASKPLPQYPESDHDQGHV
jgi:hypothetical protein